ncbi:hypothetical protein GFS24_03915 [Chitinophaga sp. SYP-B3965]|uniref:hypothetical protein n=1 Tax=Chitinophaga sp. SYP-B3965 TaxID=2663120 RepID=UPI001299D76D|nr:hypothetical protein [Chitinophaga sp. SYP-B3965]MRG44243.1 hypothetical protein [Chitinophaga sp. SYP-B3965]
MRIKILLTLFGLMFTVLQVSGQAHDNSQGACKLFKNKAIGDGATCPACVAKIEKEQKARDAENKRRNDVIIAKGEADKKAAEIARKKQLADMAEKNKVTEVAVTMPKSADVKNNAPVKKGLIENSDKAVLKVTGNGKGFKNEKDELLFENPEWDRTYSIQDVSVTETALKNFGIIDVRTGSGRGLGGFRADVVNSKGEYLFNDPNLKFICHINDGWLLMGFYNSENYCVYNLLTKNKINFTSISQYNSEFGRYVWGPAIDLFLPIFSDDVKFAQTYSIQVQGKATEGGWIKKHLMKLYPAELNAAFLSKQSFVLVHTSQLASYLGQEYEYKFEANYNSANTVILYCVSKEGKLSTIKLK